jgi:hypothetical protein
MRHLNMFPLLLAAAALAQPASAEITIKEAVSKKAGSEKVQAERTIFVKGLSMRVDARRGDDRKTTIYDAATGRIILLDPGKRRAEIHDAADVAGGVERKLPSTRVSAELAPTGQSKTMLGVECEEYTFVITAPIGATSEVLFSLRGSAWIARQAAGLEDYLSFARAAEKMQFVFGDFDSTRAVLALVRGQTELYRRIAAIGGVPYAIDLAFKFDGTGIAIAFANKMASGTTYTAATAVDTRPLADDLFTVPEGWKTTIKSPKSSGSY